MNTYRAVPNGTTWSVEVNGMPVLAGLDRWNAMCMARDMRLTALEEARQESGFYTGNREDDNAWYGVME